MPEHERRNLALCAQAMLDRGSTGLSEDIPQLIN